MPAYINQEFFTDFLKCMVHKPLALFGNEKSKEELRGIKGRGNLKWSYFVKRHKENLGLETLSKTFKSIFNKDPTVQMESSKRIGEFFAPVLGE